MYLRDPEIPYKLYERIRVYGYHVHAPAEIVRNSHQIPKGVPAQGKFEDGCRGWPPRCLSSIVLRQASACLRKEFQDRGR